MMTVGTKFLFVVFNLIAVYVAYRVTQAAAHSRTVTPEMVLHGEYGETGAPPPRAPEQAVRPLAWLFVQMLLVVDLPLMAVLAVLTMTVTV